MLLFVVMPTWSATPIEEAKFLAADGAAGDQFGYSVALSGDTAVIGARFDSDDDNGLESGSAYVLIRTGQKRTVRLARFFGKLSCTLRYYYTREFARSPDVNRIRDIHRLIQRSPFH